MRLELRLVSLTSGGLNAGCPYNSWDKNDPQDTQVLTYICFKTGVSPADIMTLVHRTNDLQELAQTHDQISPEGKVVSSTAS